MSDHNRLRVLIVDVIGSFVITSVQTALIVEVIGPFAITSALRNGGGTPPDLLSRIGATSLFSDPRSLGWRGAGRRPS